ncbi:hypothetical protein XELAEV_18005436mg [Xenopus laevis]|nr:hypothetical protein XELAEV_18005436mg [Xenopus laevis]
METQHGTPSTDSVIEGNNFPVHETEIMDNCIFSGVNDGLDIASQAAEKMHQNDNISNTDEQEKVDAPVLEICEPVGKPALDQNSTCHQEQEERMEVTVQLENLNFKNEASMIKAEDNNETKDSSSEDSSSDSDTDSDSSSSSSSILLPVEEEEVPNANNDLPLKTKGELLINELPAVEELSIVLPEDVELKPIGMVSSIIEQLVIIESMKDVPPLNEDSVIFNEGRNAVGKIFEIFGPVPHPFYVIRFNEKGQIENKGIKIKDTMFFAPKVEDFTQYIIPDKLKIQKGSDASWTNDHEPPADVLDYSDDEKEREAKQKKKGNNLAKKKIQSDQDENSSSVHEQNRNYRGQNVSRPPSRHNYGPRFSRGRAAQLHNNAFGQHPRTYFQPGFPSPHMMNQPYPFHSMQAQEYSSALPSNGHGTPVSHYYSSPYGHVHPYSLPPPPPPPPDMIWSEQNNPLHFMQNSQFYTSPPPPPPPPPLGNPNQSSFDPNYN